MSQASDAPKGDKRAKTPNGNEAGGAGDARETIKSLEESAPATFEVAIKRLSEIVQTLERGELALEESLQLFEEGVKLSRVSQQRLDAAQKKVETLLAVDDQGRATTAVFPTNADE